MLYMQKSWIFILKQFLFETSEPIQKTELIWPHSQLRGGNDYQFLGVEGDKARPPSTVPHVPSPGALTCANLNQGCMLLPLMAEVLFLITCLQEALRDADNRVFSCGGRQLSGK